VSAEQPVIRTYRARERSQAEEAYQLDAETAEQQQWYPVAHRWSSSWAGEELSVVFEHRPDGGGAVTAAVQAPADERKAEAEEPGAEAAAEPTEAAAAPETEPPQAEEAPETEPAETAEATHEAEPSEAGGEPAEPVEAAPESEPTETDAEAEQAVAEPAEAEQAVAEPAEAEATPEPEPAEGEAAPTEDAAPESEPESPAEPAPAAEAEPTEPEQEAEAPAPQPEQAAPEEEAEPSHWWAVPAAAGAAASAAEAAETPEAEAEPSEAWTEPSETPSDDEALAFQYETAPETESAAPEDETAAEAERSPGHEAQSELESAAQDATTPEADQEHVEPESAQATDDFGGEAAGAGAGAAEAEAEHRARVEAEHEAFAVEDEVPSGESLSAADDGAPWTEYDAEPSGAPDDALAREQPWVESALVDEHEPLPPSVAAAVVAAGMHDDWATQPTEGEASSDPEAESETSDAEAPADAGPSDHAEPEPGPEIEPTADAEPPAESAETAEPATDAEPLAAEDDSETGTEPTATTETEPSTDDFAAWIAAAHAQPAPPAPMASTDRSEPMSAAVPAIRSHARALVQAIDLHTCGEPLRLIRSGFPAVPLAPILERRAWLKDHLDFAREVLMWEPRGHRDMYGAILLPPYADDADISVLFMHNEGYSTMCGHGIIAITTALVEEGLYPTTTPETEIRFETPAGIVTATAPVARSEDGRHEVSSVRFQNVPSYLHERDIHVRPDGIQLAGQAAYYNALAVDLAFGGAYYGVVDAADLGLRVVPDQTEALTRAGAAITDALRRDHTPSHPTEPDLGFVYGTIIVDHDPATSPDGRAADADMRNVTIFADAEVDRSPCGSGTSALLARLHALGQLEAGRHITNAGITGEAFSAWVDAETQIGDRSAVLTSVEGHAYVTGYHTFVIDDRDPLGNGFLLR
jgi:proline racemase